MLNRFNRWWLATLQFVGSLLYWFLACLSATESKVTNAHKRRGCPALCFKQLCTFSRPVTPLCAPSLNYWIKWLYSLDRTNKQYFPVGWNCFNHFQLLRVGGLWKSKLLTYEGHSQIPQSLQITLAMMQDCPNRGLTNSMMIRPSALTKIEIRHNDLLPFVDSDIF